MKTYNKKFKKYTPLTIDAISKNVTSLVINCLKEGTIPWQSGMLNQNTVQISMLTDKPYEGLNQWILYLSAILNKYRANQWITFLECKKRGGHVLKGQKSVGLVKWNFKYLADKDCDACNGKAKDKLECPCGKTIPMPKPFAVFNVEQTSLFDEELHVPKKPEVEDVDVNVGMAHQLIADWNSVVPIRYGYDNMSCPYYSPSRDFISIPFSEGAGVDVEWVNEETLHKTTFHEIMHSTGHKSRLDRFDKAVMDGVEAGKLHNRGQYSAEELVAEMGSQILSDACGFVQNHIDNTSAYINSWISCLEKNPKWVMWASSRASKGAKMIIENSLKGGV